jgi:hypothetical protein
MMKKPKPMHKRTARLTVFALTGMVACLSSAEALETINFTGESDTAGHSSLTNTTKWTNGKSPVSNDASE